ncbi:MAG: hypothetical protein F4184_15620 [Gemmatimonadetes bacterium]|nr:hypothetical protein [Gemmatimonadota bacterium]
MQTDRLRLARSSRQARPRGISIRRPGGSRAGEVRVGRLLRNDKVTATADREGGIYEMFADRSEGVEVLMRAAQGRAAPEEAGIALRGRSDIPVGSPPTGGRERRIGR